jgi:hypothetical protein
MEDNPKQLACNFFLCAVVAMVGLGGCNRNHPTPLAQIAGSAGTTTTGIPPLTEQKLDPLTPSDVELYLRVMRAAAERVRIPSSEDMQTIARARQIISAAATGHVPSSTDAGTLQQVSQICLAMDQIVVREMQIDPNRYIAIADAIEAVVPNPDLVPPQQESARVLPRSPLERRLVSVNAANEAFLVPYRGEIQRLLSVVRNPANLPKT